MKLTEIYKPIGQHRIFVDIDGVLADFVGGVKRIFPEYDEYKYESDPKFRDKMYAAIKEYSANGGKMWLNLKPLSDAKKLWKYVSKYDPQILSATGSGDAGAGPQKREWIANHFGSDIKVNLVQQAKDKGERAQRGDILIDDKQKALDPWIAAGGIGILHTSANDTIKQLKALGL